MRPILILLGACLLSVALYGAVFGFVIEKPLTIGTVERLLEAKRDRALATPSPKLLILAGSNARVSHRCETIEAVLGMKCVNLGIGRGLGLDWLLKQWREVIRPGDLVYMPLEYDQYLDGKLQTMTGPDAALMFREDKRELFELGGERTLRAFFHFDLPFLISGAAEMALAAGGTRRRYGLETLTPQGDESGHTPDKGLAYRDYITSVQPFIPDAAMLAAPSYAKDLVSAFLRWAKANRVTVVGGLQTTFMDAKVPDAAIAVIGGIYEDAGQPFLVLENRSQYRRSCFYDTAAHLNETCQIEHSRRVAEALAGLVPVPLK
jgi:hypothetical protein